MNAISIVVFDPTGKTTGETYPPGSVWLGRGKPRRVRSDRGQARISEKQAVDNKAVTGSQIAIAPITAIDPAGMASGSSPAEKAA